MRTTNLIFVLLLLSACYNGVDVPPDQNTWEYTTPETLGYSDTYFKSLDSRIRFGEFENLNALIVLKNDQIVFENYYGDNNRSTIKPIDDATLMFASIAVGLAIGDGLLLSIDEPIQSLLPKYNDAFQSELKQQITLRHLLMHRSGLSWNDIVARLSPENDYMKMRSTSDWAKFVIDRPLEAIPGTRYNYNVGSGVLISKIIENVTGMSLSEYINNRLFEPLSITDWQWDTDPSNTADGTSGLHISQFDLTKVGFMMLKQGFWNGQSILDDGWVEESSSISSQLNTNYDLGYLWWKFSDQATFIDPTRPNDVYFIPGGTGVSLYIIPHKDMVVSINAENHFFSIFSPSMNLYFNVINGMP